MPLRCVHTIFSLLTILTAMLALDVCLILQKVGKKRTGLSFLLSVEEFSYLFVLKYLSSCVGSQMKTTRRGYAIMSWFFFVVIYDVKMYFVMSHIWSACISQLYPRVSILTETVQKNEDSKIDLMSRGKLLNDSYLLVNCGYSFETKKGLILSQSILFPSLFLLLVGELFIEEELKPKELSQIKLRSIWTVIDILDLLQLQSVSVTWEKTTSLPYQLAVSAFFYTYLSLVIVPSLALVEISRRSLEDFSPRINFLVAARMILVNTGTSIIRLLFIFLHNISHTSSIFIGKNVICFFIQICILTRKKKRDDENNELMIDLDRSVDVSASLSRTSIYNNTSVNKLDCLYRTDHNSSIMMNGINSRNLQKLSSNRIDSDNKSKINLDQSSAEHGTGVVILSQHSVESSIPYSTHNRFMVVDEKLGPESENENVINNSQDTASYDACTSNDVIQGQDGSLLFTSSISSLTTTQSSDSKTPYSEKDTSNMETCLLFTPPPGFSTSQESENFANEENCSKCLESPTAFMTQQSISPCSSLQFINTVIAGNGKESLGKETNLFFHDFSGPVTTNATPDQSVHPLNTSDMLLD